MSSSSAFSTWALNGSVLARTNGDFICNYTNDRFKGTFDVLQSWASPVNQRRQGKWSLKNGVQCRAVEIDAKSSFSVGNKFHLEDVIEAQQFDRDTLSAIFEVALEMEKIEKNSKGSQMLKGYLMATLFYEPSTRTRLSFESAMKRLGGEVLTTENAREFSSAAKGETLEGSQSVNN